MTINDIKAELRSQNPEFSTEIKRITKITNHKIQYPDLPAAVD